MSSSSSTKRSGGDDGAKEKPDMWCGDKVGGVADNDKEKGIENDVGVASNFFNGRNEREVAMVVQRRWRREEELDLVDDVTDEEEKKVEDNISTVTTCSMGPKGGFVDCRS
ncbi:hypothetical protein U1Q18_001926 [Sarracenia purpurea var. burkii]